MLVNAQPFAAFMPVKKSDFIRFAPILQLWVYFRAV